MDNSEIFKEEVQKIIDEYTDDGLLSDKSMEKILYEIIKELNE